MGLTVLGYEPLSIFRSPNMPLKGFGPESLSHMLSMLATLPISTHVVIGRVACMSNKCDKNTGSDPLRGMLGERNIDWGLNLSNVQLTEKMLILYLKARYSCPITTIGKESGGGTLI